MILPPLCPVFGVLIETPVTAREEVEVILEVACIPSSSRDGFRSMFAAWTPWSVDLVTEFQDCVCHHLLHRLNNHSHLLPQRMQRLSCVVFDRAWTFLHSSLVHVTSTLSRYCPVKISAAVNPAWSSETFRFGYSITTSPSSSKRCRPIPSDQSRRASFVTLQVVVQFPEL